MPVRGSFSEGGNVVRLARLSIAHEVQPALRPHLRADALASTTSHPAFVTTRDRPSCRNGTAGVKPLIWGLREAEYCPSCQSAARRRAMACCRGPLPGASPADRAAMGAAIAKAAHETTRALVASEIRTQMRPGGILRQ